MGNEKHLPFFAYFNLFADQNPPIVKFLKHRGKDWQRPLIMTQLAKFDKCSPGWF
jgi:hypothetical protein